MALPLVHLTGSAYDQGCQHGEALREAIAANIATYLERFERELRLSREEALGRALRYAAALAQQSPAYAAGMRGIADGAGRSYAEIAALNVRYELFYHQFGVNAMADGCTVCAVLPEASADRHLLLAENWDWLTGVRGAVLHSHEPDGLAVLAFSEAGIVGGKIGLNSAALGLLINGLTSTDDDWARLHKPFHLRCYEILRSRSLDAAIRTVSEGARSCSGNFLIAQIPDQAWNIETAPHAVARIGCRGGCLVHSNHFVDPAALGVREPPVEKNPHSYWRYERLSALLAAERPLSLADLQSALRDHQHHPYSVCFHSDPTEPPEEHYATVVSALIDLHARALYLSDGPPCENPYERYAFDAAAQQAVP
ncbi:MAG: peptidase C45 [Oscillochloris sp.]|nr:peptidase C45 [Oscillochloris sp.]